jgi:hypothetical protein
MRGARGSSNAEQGCSVLPALIAYPVNRRGQSLTGMVDGPPPSVAPTMHKPALARIRRAA